MADDFNFIPDKPQSNVATEDFGFVPDPSAVIDTGSPASAPYRFTDTTDNFTPLYFGPMKPMEPIIGESEKEPSFKDFLLTPVNRYLSETPAAELLKAGQKKLREAVLPKSLEAPAESLVQSIPGKIVTGIQSAQIDLAESFLSPIGIATLGMGTLPKAIQRVVSGGFAADMISHLPEQAKAISEAWKNGDIEQVTRGLLGFAGTGVFAAGAAKHALTPEKLSPAQIQIGKDETEKFWKGVRERQVQPPDTSEIVTEAIRNIYPSDQRPINRLRIRKFDQPTATGEQNATTQGTVQPESQLPRTPPRQDVQPNPTEVRQGTGTEANGGNSVVGGGTEPQSGAAAPVAPTPAAPPDVSPPPGPNAVLAAQNVPEGTHYLFGTKTGDVVKTPDGGNIFIVNHYGKLKDAREAAAAINGVRPATAEVEPWLAKPKNEGGKQVNKYAVYMRNVSQGIVDQISGMMTRGKEPTKGIAARLIELKAIANPTPEQVADLDALQKQSDEANAAAAAQMQAELQKLKQGAKQPWEMTQKEYSSAASQPSISGADVLATHDWMAEKLGGTKSLKDVFGDVGSDRFKHAEQVALALRQGKVVPPEVLAEYPELSKPATAPPPLGTGFSYRSPYRPVMSISQYLPKGWKLIDANTFSVDKPLTFEQERQWELEPLDPEHPTNIKKRFDDFANDVRESLDPYRGAEYTLKDGRKYLVSENVDPAGKDKYPFRITHFNKEGTPTGHDVYQNFDEVIRALWAFKDEIASSRIPEAKPPPKPEPPTVTPVTPVAAVGDRVIFTPSSKKGLPVSGIVQDVVNGGRGYNILSPLPGDPNRVVRVWLEDGKIEKTETTPTDVESLLRANVVDATEARQRVSAIDRTQAELRDEAKKLDVQIKEIEKRIKPQRGNPYTRSQIKASAKKSDVAQYRELQKQYNDIGSRLQALDDAARKDRRLIDSAVDSQIVNDTSIPLLRRIDRKVRMEQDAGRTPAPELVAALKAESKRVILEKYPDATPEEIARMQPEVERASYFNNNPWTEMGLPTPQNLRLARLDAMLNAADVPKDEFSPELMARIREHRAISRVYGGEPAPNAPVKPLSAQDIGELETAIKSETKKIHAANKVEADRFAAEKLAENLKEAKLIEDAQKVVDSAKRVGTVGGRTAKEVKAELVSRIEDEMAKMVSADTVKLEKREDGTYVASEGKGKNAFGTIEEDNGKFKVEVWPVSDAQNVVRGKMNSLAEAEAIIKTMAAGGSGNAIIAIPGDGIYKLVRQGSALLRVWEDARKLDTTSSKFSTGSSAPTPERPPKTIKTLGDWDSTKKFFELGDADTVAGRSNAMQELAERVNPESPDTVTVKQVDDWIESRKKGSDRQAQLPRADVSNQIASREWWHVPPAEAGTYSERGKFYSSSFKEAEFYGIGAEAKPEKVAVSNPIIGDEAFIEKQLLGGRQTLPDVDSPDFYKARTELDQRLAQAARDAGYDAIALTTTKGFDQYKRTGKLPASIELNTLHDIEQQTTRSPIRWVGGKRQFIPVIQRIFAPFRNLRLVEPFFGSGTVTFGLRPKAALVNDLNPELANFHQRMAKGLTYDLPYEANPEDFARARSRYNELIRAGQGTTEESAKLFYYLNQTAHGGLYRVNSRGEFNVSFQADKEGKLIRSLEDYRDAYNNVTVESGNYLALKPKSGDFIYSDPPYDSQFKGYDATGFTWEDQQKHAQWLSEQKVPVMTQNEATPRILEMYRNLGFDVWQIPARRMISRDVTGRVGGVMEMMAFKNIPEDHISKSLEGTGAIHSSTPEAQFGIEVPRTVRETTAVGLDQIRELFSDPRLGYNAEEVQNALRLLEQPVFKKLDWSKLILSIRRRLEGNAGGQAWVADNLIEMSGNADVKTFPHEVFHFLYELLPKEYRDALNELRLAELRKIYGDNIPEEMASGKMSTDYFVKSGVPREQYHLSTPSEYLAEFASERFVKDTFNIRNNTFWEQFKSDVKGWVQAIVDWAKRGIGITPDKERMFRELLAGVHKNTPETGIEYEARQAQLARSPEEYQKQKFFEERAASERAVGAYADITSLKNQAADAIDAGTKARRLTNIPKQELIAALGSIDMAYERLAFGNYAEMRARTEGSDPGLRSGVILDALRGMEFEQRRAIKLRDRLAEQTAVIQNPRFREKMATLMDRRLTADSAEEIRKTYRNQISQSAGNVMRELAEKGKTDAQYEQLRNDLARLKQLPEFTEAVAQRVEDIINTVSSTEGGLQLLFQGADRTGTQIYRAYLDLMQSVNQRKAGIPSVDPALLSAADREKLAQSQVTLTGDQKAFAQLASSLLAANTELRLKLTTLAYFKDNPAFQAQVTAVGEQFRKQFKQDPSKAIDTIVKTADRLRKKEMDAQAAWLRLHKEILPEIQKFQTYREAVAIDDAVSKSQQYQDLVNQIHQDAKAVRIPDSELKEITASSVWNEFTGRQVLRSPKGTRYEIDLGYTKAKSAQNQKMLQAYLGDVTEWLGNPANDKSPDRAYWNMRYDFADAVLNTSTMLSPTSTIPLGGIKSAWGMMEFFFKSANLPEAKLAFTASNNFQRAWVISDQWYNRAEGQWRTTLIQAAQSHQMDPNFDLRQYQEQVLDRLASEYRHGNALRAGDRLNNGITLTQQDINAFRFQGQVTKELFDQLKNIGREKVMVDGLLIDEHAKNVFSVRAPQELGAEAGTTLPHDFSGRAKALASVVAQNPGETVRILDQDHNFEEFVKRFIAERRSDFSRVTPFEDLYKQIAEMWRDNDPNAPKSIEEIVDYIEQNSPTEVTREQIEGTLVGEMRDQLTKFYQDFVAKEEATDVRALRATKQSAFTTGFRRDVGSSFFYDYGAVASSEIRSLGIDSTNFHLVRFVKSLDSLVEGYDRALAEYNSLTGLTAKEKFTKERMARYKSGEDFRNYERLMSERSQAQYYRKNIGSAYGSQTVQMAEMFSNLGRMQSDLVSGALSGLMSVAKVYTGSIVKMGLVLGQVNRFYMGAYVRGAVSTLLSTLKLGTVGAIKVPYLTIKAMRRESGWNSLAVGLETFVESLFRQGTFFNQQYQYGLGFKQPVGYRIYNILKNPYAHGRGYEAKVSSKSLKNLPSKAFWRVLSGFEAPLEIVRSIFPQLAYAISYDAGARAGAWTVDAMASQARRSFEYLEKTGGLSAYDFDHPSDLGNLIPANYILPRGFFPKGQTNLNTARDWWQRGIDVPLNEMVINYWKKLSQTPREQRGDVSFMAADILDSSKVKVMEERRMGSLLSILLKDIHHNAPENRPMVFRENRLAQFVAPLMGWTLHSVRGTLQGLGHAPTDVRGPKTILALSAMAILGFVASTILGGEAEKGLKKVISEGMLGEDFPEKMIWEGKPGTEQAKILAIDSVTWIPMMHSIMASLLGESMRTVNDTGVSIFTVDKVQSLLRYFKGVIATGDLSYGLPGLVKQMVPFGRVIVNQLDSQKGLLELKNARTIVQKFGPGDLLDKQGPIQYSEPTELSPYKQKLVSAVFNGDPQQIQQASQEFLNQAKALGKDDQKANDLLRSAIASMNPMLIGGRKMTEDEHQTFLGELSPQNRTLIDRAENNWQSADRQMGFNTPIAKLPEGGGTVRPFGTGRPSLGRLRQRLTRTRARVAGRLRSLRMPKLRQVRSRSRNRVRTRAKRIGIYG